MRNILILVFFLGSWSLFAQQATLSGYVRDAKSGEALVGVSVIVEGTDRGSVTDLDGYYRITDIPPSTYNITASYVGYEQRTKYNVILRSAGNPELNFELNEVTTELEGVTVTANPFETLDETPLSINKLSREEIATYPGGNNDIAKVAQSLPGVASSIGGFRNDIIIRGGAPNENVYYLDGVEIPSINHFSTQGSAGGPVGLLNVSFFEGVTLSTSSFGAQYDNVLSGVLQFEQRRGNDRDFAGNIRVSASEAALTLEGPLFKGKEREAARTSAIVSVRRSYLQLLFQALDLPFLPDYWDYQYKVDHQINEYNTLSITGVGSFDDFRINVPDDYDPEQQAVLEQVPVIKQWTTAGGVSWKKRFRDGSGFMQTTVSVNVLDNQFIRYADNVNEENPLFTNDSQEREQKLRYQLTKFAGDWTFTAGGVIQHACYQNNTLDQVNNFDYATDIKFWRYGVHGQASKPWFNQRLVTSFGLRVDGNTFTDSGNELWRTLSPRASFSYKLNSKASWELNGSLGRYYKIPPYTVLGFQETEGSFSNQNVDYIRSDHAVLGLAHLPWPGFKVSLEAFYKHYSDYPVSLTDSVSLANLGAGFEVLGNEPVASTGTGRAYGLEVFAQQKFTKNFYAILAYTLFRSEFSAFDSNYLPAVWDNRHLLTFTGGYKFGNNWEVSLRTRILGGAPYPPVNIEETQVTYPILSFDYDRLGELRLGVFEQTDLRVDKKWNFKSWTLDIFIEINNLFATANPEPPSYGYQRDESGALVPPLTVVPIPPGENNQVLPNIGIVIDF